MRPKIQNFAARDLVSRVFGSEFCRPEFYLVQSFDFRYSVFTVYLPNEKLLYKYRMAANSGNIEIKFFDKFFKITCRTKVIICFEGAQ